MAWIDLIAKLLVFSLGVLGIPSISTSCVTRKRTVGDSGLSGKRIMGVMADWEDSGRYPGWEIGGDSLKYIIGPFDCPQSTLNL